MNKSSILESLIKYYSAGNKAQFAYKLGVKPQTINTWISRNTFDTDLIYSKCEHLSADWLLTGEGEMLRTPSVSQSANGNHNMQVAGNANNVHSSPDAARLLNLIESQQRTIERQAATIENLSRR